MSKIDEIWIPLPLENPRETCIAKGTPKVIKNDVEKPSIWRSSKNQLFDTHNDHYLETSDPLNSQRILYNKGSLKNVRLEEEKDGVFRYAWVPWKRMGPDNARIDYSLAYGPLQSNWTSSDTWVFWMCLNASYFLFLCATGFMAILTTRRFHKSDEFSPQEVALFKI